MRTFVIIIVLLALLTPFFLGRWCAFNTELLANYYHQGKQINMPRWPFVVGAYLTQLGLPYGLITEIWCHCVGVK